MRPTGIALHAVIPIATVVLAFTSSAHTVFRGTPELYQSMGLTLVHADYQWFHNFVFVPYQYAVYLSGVVIIIEAMGEAHRRFRTGYLLMIGAMILPWIGGALYALSIPPFVDLNPTSLLLLVTIGVYLTVLQSDDFLDLTPIGRPQIMERLQEGLIVLDRLGRIIDVNPTALNLLPSLAGSDDAALIGHRLRDLVPDHVPLLLLAEGIETDETAFEIDIDGEPRYYLVRPTAITDSAGAFRGRALSVLDITTATLLVQSLQTERQRREQISEEALLNRREFLRRLEHETHRAAAFGRRLSLAILRAEAGQPEEVRSRQEEELRHRCGPVFWMSWMSPEELFVLVPECDRDTLEDTVMESLVEPMMVAAVYSETGRRGLTREEFVLNARRAIRERR